MTVHLVLSTKGEPSSHPLLYEALNLAESSLLLVAEIETDMTQYCQLHCNGRCAPVSASTIDHDDLTRRWVQRLQACDAVLYLGIFVQSLQRISGCC